MDITNINHVGMAVRDLAQTARRYEAMGFQLTPYSPHSGAFKPGEPVKPLGSGNRCVMFANNYLEILASEDPKQPAARITNFLNHHQGAHIICFDSDDCSAVDARLLKGGVETSGVIPLQREIDTPQGERTAKFERVQFAPKDTPEGYIQAARHLTPQYIYQQRYIAHDNGCTQLTEAFLVALDMDRTVARYRTYIGAEPPARRCNRSLRSATRHVCGHRACGRGDARSPRHAAAAASGHRGRHLQVAGCRRTGQAPCRARLLHRPGARRRHRTG